MEIAEVSERIDKIRAEAGDPERAHAAQDALYADVLRAIAEGAEHPRRLARAALKAAEIDFDHWMA